MSTITVRDAKIEDAARILEIYAYYVEHTVILSSGMCRRWKNSKTVCGIS